MLTNAQAIRKLTLVIEQLGFIEQTLEDCISSPDLTRNLEAVKRELLLYITLLEYRGKDDKAKREGLGVLG